MKQLHGPSRNQQQGMTLISWLAIASVVGALALCGMRLAPIYIDYWTVKSTFEGLYDENNPLTKKPSKKDVTRLVYNRLRMNQVETFHPEEIKIEELGNEVIITANYEVRAELIFNIDAVVKFNENSFNYPKR